MTGSKIAYSAQTYSQKRVKVVLVDGGKGALRYDCNKGLVSKTEGERRRVAVQGYLVERQYKKKGGGTNRR